MAMKTFKADSFSRSEGEPFIPVVSLIGFDGLRYFEFALGFLDLGVLRSAVVLLFYLEELSFCTLAKNSA